MTVAAKPQRLDSLSLNIFCLTQTQMKAARLTPLTPLIVHLEQQLLSQSPDSDNTALEAPETPACVSTGSVAAALRMERHSALYQHPDCQIV